MKEKIIKALAELGIQSEQELLEYLKRHEFVDLGIFTKKGETHEN